MLDVTAKTMQRRDQEGRRVRDCNETGGLWSHIERNTKARLTESASRKDRLTRLGF